MADLKFHQLLVPDTEVFVHRLLARNECQTALDIGCGKSSYLARFRPSIRTVGLDAFEGAIQTSRKLNLHDEYILANIIETPVSKILESREGKKFDLVAMFDLIEHLPKRMGWELLEKCEQLSDRYIVLQTPYGFLEQGPEDSNTYQRHLSGWFPHDFEGLGYTVAGTAGTKCFHGYAGKFKWNFPGVKLLDYALGFLLNLERNPRYAFNIVAWKDLNGVPARL
ncbi:MAG: class I SAM-dependent methyltransferase [Verrucomicrobiota bacterium]|nr:class I SAM-dependent methyltransferase [Verrucomicrobiota bacterium]